MVDKKLPQPKFRELDLTVSQEIFNRMIRGRRKIPDYVEGYLEGCIRLKVWSNESWSRHLKDLGLVDSFEGDGVS